MPEPKQCQSCGEAIGASARFCGACGAEQIEQATESSSTPAARYCSACGAGLPSDSSFCTECGARVEEVPAAPAPSAAGAASRRSPQPTQPWYTKTWAAVVALLFFFPLGLFLMWRFQRWEVWIKTAITVVGSLFAIFIIVAAAVGGEDDDGEAVGQEASPSPPVEASPSPAVEAPIATPEATPTAELTLPPFTAGECQYLSEVGEQATDVGNAFSDMGEIAVRDDFLSDEWTFAMALQFVIIELTRDAALALDPPASLGDIHTKWLSILDTAVQATELMTEGIDELDASKIDAASELILDVTLETLEVTPLIVEFGASRSGECP